MSPTLFRCLIIGSVLLAVSAGLIDQFFPPVNSPSFAEALEREAASGLIESHPIMSLALLLLWLAAYSASTVGLLFFRRWARSGAFYCTLLGFSIYFLFGPELSSALASVLTDASSMAWGAVLTLAYFSPLSGRFAEQTR